MLEPSGFDPSIFPASIDDNLVAFRAIIEIHTDGLKRICTPAMRNPEEGTQQAISFFVGSGWVSFT